MIDEPGTPFPSASGVTLEPGLDPPLPVAPALPTPWVTIALIAANTIVFVITLALGANPLLPDAEKMYTLGGNFAPSTLSDEPWRLVTAMFLHYGVLHIAMNMFGLWSGGLLAERMYGRVGYATMYLLAGLAGGVATVSHKSGVVSAGASGAIFGVFGAIGAYLLAHREQIDQTALRKQARGLLFFMGYNLLYGASQKSIDMSAHLGGVMGGFVVGLALTYGSRGRHSLARAALVAVVGLGAIAGAVRALHVPAENTSVVATAMHAQAYDDFDQSEKAVLASYTQLVKSAQADLLSDVGFAEGLERDVLPPWTALEQRIITLPPPPARLRPLHTAILAYLAARREAWVAFDDLLRGRTTDSDHVKQLRTHAEDTLRQLDAASAALK